MTAPTRPDASEVERVTAGMERHLEILNSLIEASPADRARQAWQVEAKQTVRQIRRMTANMEKRKETLLEVLNETSIFVKMQRRWADGADLERAVAIDNRLDAAFAQALS